MLAIRMQRTGRRGHAQFRVIVQDSRRHPSSGNIVAMLGSYDPHTKTAKLEKEKAATYLEHGAQPSDRVARLLKSEGVKLPNWVKLPSKKEGVIKNPEKLRKNRPAGAEAPPTKAEKEEVTAEVKTEEPATEAPAGEASAEATPAEPEAEKPETTEKSPE